MCQDQSYLLFLFDLLREWTVQYRKQYAEAARLARAEARPDSPAGQARRGLNPETGEARP